MAWHAFRHEISEHKHNCLSVCPRNTPGTGHTCLQQHLTEHFQKTFTSPSKSAAVKKEEKKRKAIAIFLRYMQTNISISITRKLH